MRLLTMRLFVITLLLHFVLSSAAQKKDTVVITADKVRTAYLKPGINRYLVYMKNGLDSNRIRYQMWTRTVGDTVLNGKKALSIQQVWEDNDTIIHKVTAVCDAKTFATYLYNSWWKTAGKAQFDFVAKKAFVRNKELSDSMTQPAAKKMYDAFTAASGQYFLNWHLDLEVFSILPYKDGVTFMINFYDPGFAAPQLVAYTVTGSDVLKNIGDLQIDCWLLKHQSAIDNKETFWISKKTREVVKLEQEFKGRYRYKIKLGFSA